MITLIDIIEQWAEENYPNSTPFEYNQWGGFYSRIYLDDKKRFIHIRYDLGYGSKLCINCTKCTSRNSTEYSWKAPGIFIYMDEPDSFEKLEKYTNEWLRDGVFD